MVDLENFLQGGLVIEISKNAPSLKIVPRGTKIQIE